MRVNGSSNQSPGHQSTHSLFTRRVLWLGHRFEDRVMLIAFVQLLVGADDKQPHPIEETGGNECAEHANNYLLEKGGMHLPLSGAAPVPFPEWGITRIPTVSFS